MYGRHRYQAHHYARSSHGAGRNIFFICSVLFFVFVRRWFEYEFRISLAAPLSRSRTSGISRAFCAPRAYRVPRAQSSHLSRPLILSRLPCLSHTSRRLRLSIPRTVRTSRALWALRFFRAPRTLRAIITSRSFSFFFFSGEQTQMSGQER